MDNQKLLEKINRRSRTNTLLLVITIILLAALILFAAYSYVSVKNAVAAFTAEYNKLKAVTDTIDPAALAEMLNGLGEIDMDTLSQALQALDPEVLNGVLGQLGSIDVDALNEAIGTLNKLGGTLGKLFG